MSRRRRRLSTLLGAVAAVAALGVALAAFALASTATLKLSSVQSGALGEQVAVNPQGRTLYELSGETAHRLLCRTAACLRFWPPLSVPSRATKLKLGAGLRGRLSLLRRHNRMLQVTLNGHPLYRYSGDHGRAQGHGQGIVSFGGAWHAVTGSGAAPAPSAATPAPNPYPATTQTATTPPPPPTTTETARTTPKYPPYPPY